MIQRNISPKILEALADTPVVLLVGARQVGKTTLVEHIVAQGSVGEEKTEYLWCGLRNCS